MSEDGTWSWRDLAGEYLRIRASLEEGRGASTSAEAHSRRPGQTEPPVTEDNGPVGEPLRDEILRDGILGIFLVAIIVLLAAFLPSGLDDPADPFSPTPEVPPLPDWYFLWTYGYLKLAPELSLSITELAAVVLYIGAAINGLIAYRIWRGERYPVARRDSYPFMVSGGVLALGGILLGTILPAILGVSMTDGVVEYPVVDERVVIASPALVGTLLTGLFVLLLIILPFVSRGRPKRPGRDPVMAAIGVGVILHLIFLSVYGCNTVILHDHDLSVGWLGLSGDDLLRWLVVLPPLLGGYLTYDRLTIREGTTPTLDSRLNLCHDCGLCDSVCPVPREHREGRLNLVMNTHRDEHGGMDPWSCLTCGRCTEACPQDGGVGIPYPPYVLAYRESLPASGVLEDDDARSKRPDVVMPGLQKVMEREAALTEKLDVEDVPRAEDVLFVGCLGGGRSLESTMSVLAHVGIEPAILTKPLIRCCGHDLLWQGNRSGFESLRTHNTEVIEATGCSRIICSCAEGYQTLKEWYDLPGITISHTTEVLYQEGFRVSRENGDGRTGDIDEDLGDPVTVTYHDPCRLSRFQDVSDQPRSLLYGLPGVSLVEPHDNRRETLCCGYPGLMDGPGSSDVNEARREQLEDTGADIILTSCTKCTRHLRGDTPVRDIIGFLHDRLQGDIGLDEDTEEVEDND